MSRCSAISDRLDTQFRLLLDKKSAYDESRNETKRLEAEYREYEAELWEGLENQHGKIKTFGPIDLGPGYGEVRFTRTERRDARINDEEALVEWAKANGLDGELLTPGVRKRVLSERVRDALDHGRELPPGTDFYATRRISVTRKSQKKG